MNPTVSHSPVEENVIVSLLYPCGVSRKDLLVASHEWDMAAENPEAIEHIFPSGTEAELRQASAAECKIYPQDIIDPPAITWNRIAGVSRGQILIQLPEILAPIKNWDSKMTSRFRDLSKPGVLRVSDMLRVDDVLSIAIFTRSYLNLLGGKFFSEEYLNSFFQDEFSFRAYQRGVVIDARDIVLDVLATDGKPARDSTLVRNEIDGHHRDKHTFLRRNPSARGHWLHEGTDQRYYLPPGHFYAQNILGCSIAAPSPLARNIPDPASLPPAFNYQVGYQGPSPVIKQHRVSDLWNKVFRSAKAAIAAWSPKPYQSTLWGGEKRFESDKALAVAVHSKIPVFIIHFEQPDYLLNTIKQLEKLHVSRHEIIILDNASRGGESKKCLQRLRQENFRVIELERNFGPHGIFTPESGIEWPEVFALTDPDLQFHPETPVSFRRDLLQIAIACRVWKCGCAISIKDAEKFTSASYLDGKTICEWERQHWQRERNDLPVELAKRLRSYHAKVYEAPIDTTFAVYRRDASRSYFVEAVRVSGAYECKHLPWYETKQPLDGALATYYSASKRYYSTTKHVFNN